MRKKVGDYMMEGIIGSGAYGEVYKGHNTKDPNEVFAIKMIAKKTVSEKVFRYLEREVEILQMLNHDHVVKLKDIKATENHYYLIFEYCNGGDLAQYRKGKGGKVDEKLARYFLTQVVAGMDALYVKKAIHRDIKLSNILLSYPTAETRVLEKPIVKLGDFGFARLIKQSSEQLEASVCEEIQPMSIVGTPLYMAPELFNRKPYSFKVDIWSLGTCIYELLCGQNCFSGISKDDLAKNIHKGIYKVPKVLGLSTECLDFLHNCIQLNPENRAKWKALREHPFVVTDHHTRFDIMKFRQQNPGLEDMLEDDNNYIFNCNKKYVFLAEPTAVNDTTKEEDEKTETGLIESGALPVKVGESLSEIKESDAKNEEKRASKSITESKTDEILVVEEESEYVKIENRKISKSGPSEYTATKTEELCIEDKYFG